MRLSITAFTIFFISVSVSPSLSSDVAAAPLPAAGIELFSLGYGLDAIVLTERNGLATRSMLLRIDPIDGKIIEIGDTGFSNCKALDFTPGGDLLANCQRPDPPHEPVLIMLDPQTGEGTEIGETGITENISDMSINASGDKFAYEEPEGIHNLHKVDASTGAASFVGNPGIEGKGNAIFFWGSLNTLKLVAWGEDQNRVFELDQETAQPTFITKLEMVDLTGSVSQEAPCLMIAAASTRSLGLEPILKVQKPDSMQATTAGLATIDGFEFEAIGLTEIVAIGGAASSGVDSRLAAHPLYALSLIDIEGGISILTKTIEPGYILDGIALRPPPPRPIPTVSEWGMITASAFLMLAALYFIFRKRQSIDKA